MRSMRLDGFGMASNEVAAKRPIKAEAEVQAEAEVDESTSNSTTN